MKAIGYFLGLILVLVLVGVFSEEKEYGPVEGGTRWERMGKERGDPKWLD